MGRKTLAHSSFSFSIPVHEGEDSITLPCCDELTCFHVEPKAIGPSCVETLKIKSSEAFLLYKLIVSGICYSDRELSNISMQHGYRGRQKEFYQEIEQEYGFESRQSIIYLEIANSDYLIWGKGFVINKQSLLLCI